jgi:dihydrofolate synthase / folylpolyglutamate synthase
MNNGSKYQETIAYLQAKLPMFHRIGATAFKKDLTNTLVLCDKLGNPHLKFPSIHIAGTNGKGTSAHLLAATFQSAGYKTGLYTSPHYKDFRERMKVNGKMISQKEVIHFVDSNKEIIEKIQPSFFEVTVAMAFDFFRNQKVDVAIIEVGMGGRLDSTNVVSPLLSIITNISFDHMAFLGDTLPKIAGEKAGIIKSGIPILIGEKQEETTEVFLDKAELEKSLIFWAEDHVDLKSVPVSNFSNSIQGWVTQNFPGGKTLETKEFWNFGPIDSPIVGPYQEKNIRTCYAAIQLFNSKVLYSQTPKNSPILKEHFESALRDIHQLVCFQGRWQMRKSNGVTIILESAHNEAGISAAIGHFDPEVYKNMKIVFGTVSDKDLSKVLPLLPKEATYYWCKADIPRGKDAKILQREALDYHLVGRVYSSVKNAFKAAKRGAKKDEIILVTGSIFVVAEV